MGLLDERSAPADGWEARWVVFSQTVDDAAAMDIAGVEIKKIEYRQLYFRNRDLNLVCGTPFYERSINDGPWVALRHIDDVVQEANKKGEPL